MNELLESETSVLVFDTPGILAFYTNLKIFPSDGLMNDFKYNSDLINEGALTYFCSRKINYALMPIPSEDNKIFYGLHVSMEKKLSNYILTLSSPIYKIQSEPIFLEKKNIIKSFENPLNTENKKFPFLAIWKLPC
jgi:hypothetical protein